MPFFKIKIVWKLIIKNNIFILELFHQNFESHLACLCLLFFGWQLAHHLHCPFFKNPGSFSLFFLPQKRSNMGNTSSSIPAPAANFPSECPMHQKSDPQVPECPMSATKTEQKWVSECPSNLAR